MVSKQTHVTAKKNPERNHKSDEKWWKIILWQNERVMKFCGSLFAQNFRKKKVLSKRQSSKLKADMNVCLPAQPRLSSRDKKKTTKFSMNVFFISFCKLWSLFSKLNFPPHPFLKVRLDSRDVVKHIWFVEIDDPRRYVAHIIISHTKR